jgi:arylformamidase
VSADVANATTVLYCGMDRAALDAAYNNSAAVVDSADYLRRWRDRSALVRMRGNAVLDLRYGARPRALLDFFSSGNSKAPLFVFIHGGYWQRNEKETFAFVAEGPMAHGIDVAVVGYTLAPDARLGEIVAEIKEALTYLERRAGELGFDRGQMFIGGWSAGGHLTAAAADHPSVCGGMPISGIFDLEPIALTYLNDKLTLSADEIARLSPLLHAGAGLPPLSLFVGEAELSELRRQSQSYAQAARQRGAPVELTVLSGHHHFSILDEWSRNGALTRELVRLAATG